MIRYAPLWETMARQKVTTYTLRFKYDMPVSTHTLDKLCSIFFISTKEVAHAVHRFDVPKGCWLTCNRSFCCALHPISTCFGPWAAFLYFDSNIAVLHALLGVLRLA